MTLAHTVGVTDLCIYAIGSSAPRKFGVGRVKRIEQGEPNGGMFVIEDLTDDEGVYHVDGPVRGYRTVDPAWVVAYNPHLWQDIAWEQLTYRAAMRKTEQWWAIARGRTT